MKKIISVCIFVSSFYTLFAQNAVLLQHQGNSAPYYGSNGLVDACNAAVHGDTIYLPGGFFTPATINKRIAVIGAGHHPDSTVATLPTTLIGGFNITEDADSCFISGLRVNGTITFDYGAAIHSPVLSRLFVDGTITSSSGPNFVQNLTISECTVTGEIYGLRFVLANIVHNIILYRINDLTNCMVANNIILGGDDIGGGNNRIFYGLKECTVRNNIIYRVLADLPGCINTQFNKNIFANDPPQTNNIFSGNYININTANVFVNYNGSAFSYAQDFHLKTPASYPGTDNTQVGLYGTTQPWKPGSVPLNPHIISKTIAENTNSNGQIQVQIKVAAQNN